MASAYTGKPSSSSIRQPKGPPARPPAYQDIHGSLIEFDKDKDDRLVQLGSGGFGVVYRGSYSKLGTMKVAIKRIKKTEYGIDEKILKQLKREARNMYHVRHPDILTVFGIVCDDSNQTDQIFALVTEYMERGSLDNLLDKVRVPWPVKMKMLEEVSRGILFLCTKQSDRPYEIIHGDIKTANILIDYNFRAKISDFGTSKLQKITTKTTNIPYQFTVTHVAPELLDLEMDESGDCNPEPTEASDVWSFGITAFEVCAENKPDPANSDVLDRLPFKAGLTEAQLTRMIHRKMNSLFTPLQKQKIPEDCPQYLYQLCEDCCRVTASHRPNFTGVHKYLMQNFEKNCRVQFNKAMVQLYTNIQNEHPEMMDVSETLPSFNIDSPDVSFSGAYSGSSSEGNPEIVIPGSRPFTESPRENRMMLGNNNLPNMLGSIQQQLTSLNSKVNELIRDQEATNSTRHTAEIQHLIQQAEIKSRDMSYIKQELNRQQAMQGRQLADISDQLRNQPTASDVHQLQNQVGNLPTKNDLVQAFSQYMQPVQTVYQYKQPVLGDNIAYLLDNLDPNEIQDYLYQEHLIEDEELTILRGNVPRRRQAELIVKKVDTLGEDAVAKFIVILDLTQGFIADYLRHGFRRLKLIQHLPLMKQHLRPDNIIVKLYSQGVLTMSNKEVLRAEVTTSGKVEKLFDIIYKSEDLVALDKLVLALDQSDQPILADYLRN